MNWKWLLFLLGTAVVLPTSSRADLAKDLRKQIERSTLDQPGTRPFHLKAVVAPSFERDKDSGRNGEVEIWWASPTQWKHEVRAPQFHQIEVVNGSQHWQKNDGDYFPEWLRETAIELIKPVPAIDEVLEHAKSAEVRHLGRMTNLNWTTPSGTTEIPNILRSWIAFQDSTGLLLYDGGLGWGGEFKDYEDFHGRMVARTVNVGSPQVTATVTTLEDLRENLTGLLAVPAAGGDSQLLQTVVLTEAALRQNLLPMEPVQWPPLQDGPLEGNVTTKIIVDRNGKVRETQSVVSENPAISDAGVQAILAMRFKPFLINGVSVQVLSQVTFPFKTVRPAGRENFESARTYFENGRHASFPAFGGGAPYVLRAEFQAMGSDKQVKVGRYEDTWLSASQWRREAWFENGHYVRSRDGERLYQLVEGPDQQLLQLVFRVLEPIPAIDTFVESDWKIKRDTVNGVSAVRVLAGYESPEGELDPDQARGFWFDDSGVLLKTYFNGLESRRSQIEEFASVKVARDIDVLRQGRLAMRITVKEVTPVGSLPEHAFEIKGHEWIRAFTSEVR